MAANKFYVVWKGRQTGIFSNWESCKMQVEGFQGAMYKSFPDRQSAEEAFNNGRSNVIKYSAQSDDKPIYESIAVDAACSGNPGKVEYQGVYVKNKQLLFKSPVFEYGTNNIGEFLAIVHCLAWQKKNNYNFPIYSDSVNAQKWVHDGICKTKLVENEKNKYLFEVIKRAENWLQNNTFRVPIYKWKTEVWGEIPADFGRK